jgi:CRP-like cAMP-binding protein
MIEKDTLKRLLYRLDFTADLPEHVLDECAALATLADLAAGTTLFEEGACNPFLYVVVRGRVALDIQVPGRGQVRVLSIEPGEMLAWSALLGGGTMTVSAVALEDTQMLALPGAKLLDVCQTNPDAGFQVMRRMADALAQRLVATRLQLLDLFAEPAGNVPFRR